MNLFELPQPKSNQQIVKNLVNPAQQFVNQMKPYSGGSKASARGPSQSAGPQSYSQSYSAPPPDPYAKYGGQANYDKQMGEFNKQKSGIHTSSDEAIGTAGRGIRGSVLDLISSLQGSQSKVDNRARNNELAKIQGSRGVLDMVGRGIRSGGVTLANKNASDSSAAGALARAYGDLGRREMGDLNNEYAVENSEIGLLQEDIERQKSKGIRNIDEDIADAVSSIANKARNSLAALDAAMADADMMDRIAIGAERDKVKARALNALGQYEKLVRQRAGQVKAQSREQLRAKAFNLSNEGVAADVPYDYTAEMPGTLQGTGPFASELPLFTFPKQEEE